MFFSLSETIILKDRINTYFPNGIKLTKEEIFKRMNLAFVEANMDKTIRTEVLAVRQLKLYKRVYRKKGEGKVLHTILSDNPFEFIKLETFENIEGDEELTIKQDIE